MKAQVNFDSLGGGLTPTTLWSNPSPSAEFGVSTVTLSKSISNFRYICFKYKDAAENTVIIPADEFASYLEGVSNKPTLYLAYTGTYTIIRRLFYVSDTSVKFSDTSFIGTSGYNNSRLIPLEIIGLA